MLEKRIFRFFILIILAVVAGVLSTAALGFAGAAFYLYIALTHPSWLAALVSAILIAVLVVIMIGLLRWQLSVAFRTSLIAKILSKNTLVPYAQMLESESRAFLHKNAPTIALASLIGGLLLGLKR